MFLAFNFYVNLNTSKFYEFLANNSTLIEYYTFLLLINNYICQTRLRSNQMLTGEKQQIFAMSKNLEHRTETSFWSILCTKKKHKYPSRSLS